MLCICTNHTQSNTHPVTFIASARLYNRSLGTPCSLEKAQHSPLRQSYLSVPTTGGKDGSSCASYHQPGRERARWKEDERRRRRRRLAGGESPRRVRPQHCFPMPVSDHQSRRDTKYSDFDFNWHETFVERRGGKQDRGRLMTLTSALRDPSGTPVLNHSNYIRPQILHEISLTLK